MASYFNSDSRYFDLAHGGYFENKDLEDILLFSVSNLSRAQVKRLVAKVNSEKDKVMMPNM